MKKALILASHMDDEIWSAGLINKLSAEFDFECLFFSDCGNEKLHKETADSMDILGILSYSTCDFKVRNFNKKRQKILDAMIEIRKESEPELVITHPSSSFHQDHKVI